MVSWGLKIRGQQPIGLDIGHNSIRMIQLLIDDEQISVIAADETHIDAGVSQAFFKREYQYALSGKETPGCRTEACNACGLERWQPACQQKHRGL